MNFKAKWFYTALTMLLATITFTGCSGGQQEVITGKAKMKAMKTDHSGIPVIGTGSSGGPVFEVNGRKYTVWGVEDDQWQTLAHNRAFFHKYLEGSKYTNANCIAVHYPWKVLEPEKDSYDFADFDYYLDECRKNDLKVIIYWTSTDYAAGDNVFTPDYILKDKSAYSRIVLDELKDLDEKLIPLCPADPELLDREKKAVTKLFEHIKQVNNDGTILAVNIGSEMDFIHDLKVSGKRNLDIRCECENCNKNYTSSKGKLEYMTEIFSNYIKQLIDTAASVFDMPTYTPVASLMYWPGGRFVEQPDIIKSTVNRKNHFVCPSIAPTTGNQIFIKEMDQFMKIPGNYAFASGIDTGGVGNPFDNQSHLEIAPWLNIFHYDGLGAIYWDHPEMTVTKTKGVREKLRTGWGPLKAAEYYLSPLKGDEEVTLWWSYDEKEKAGHIGLFDVSVKQDGANYGYAVCLDQRELIVSATTFKNKKSDITITGKTSFENFKFEKGHFDSKGVWIKAAEFMPDIKGNTLSFSIDGDSGDYSSCVYRISK